MGHLLDNKVMQALEVSLIRRVMMKKLLGQPYGAQRQGNNLFDVAFFRTGEFATAAAQINQQKFWWRYPQTGDHAKVNQPALFKPGNDLKVPTGYRLHPLRKEPCVIAVTQGAGSHYARALNRITLYRAMKTPQDLQGLGHGLGIEIAIAKDTFTQTSDFAVLMKGNQASTAQFGNAEPD